MNGEAVVFDGKEGPEFYAILRVSFIPPELLLMVSSAGRLMYAGRSLENGSAVVMLDGEPILRTGEDLGERGFSPDGRHAYIVEKGDIFKLLDTGMPQLDTLYVDGRNVGQFYSIANIRFSQDSKSAIFDYKNENRVGFTKSIPL